MEKKFQRENNSHDPVETLKRGRRGYPSALESVLIAAVVTVPSLVCPVSASLAFDGVKALALRFWGTSAFIMLLAYSLRNLLAGNAKRFIPKELVKSPAVRVCAVLALWLISLSVSAVFSLTPGHAWFGAPGRGDGLATVFSCVSLFAAAVIVCRSKRSAERLLLALFIGSAVPTAVGLFQVAGSGIFAPAGGFPEGRPLSTSGNAIVFGCYLTAVLPAAALCVHRTGGVRRIVVLGVMLLQLFLLWKTASRGPILGLLAATVIGALLQFRRKGFRNAAVSAACALVVLSGITLGGVQLLVNSNTARINDTNGMFTRFNTVKVRVLLYQAMTRRFLSPKPLSVAVTSGRGNGGNGSRITDKSAVWRRLFGYGPSCLAEPIISELTPEFELSEGYEHIPDSTHSQMMNMLGSSGAAGLLIYSLFLAMLIRASRRSLEFEISQRQRHAACMIWLICSVTGISLLMSLWGMFAWALGLFFGLILALFLSLGYLIYRERGNGAVLPGRTSKIIAATAASGAIGLWTEAQFGIDSVASQMIFFLYAGIITASSITIPEEHSEKPRESVFDGETFLIIVALAGSSAALLTGVYPFEEVGRGAGRIISGAFPRAVALRLMPLAVIPMLLFLRGRCFDKILFVAFTLIVSFAAITPMFLPFKADIALTAISRLSSASSSEIRRACDYALSYKSFWPSYFESKARTVAYNVIRAAGAGASETDYDYEQARAVSAVSSRPFFAPHRMEHGRVLERVAGRKREPERTATALAAEKEYDAAMTLAPGMLSNARRKMLLEISLLNDKKAAFRLAEKMLRGDPENAAALSVLFLKEKTAGEAADADESKRKHYTAAVLLGTRALRSRTLAANRIKPEPLRRDIRIIASWLKNKKIAVPELPKIIPVEKKRISPAFPGKEAAGELRSIALRCIFAFLTALCLTPVMRNIARKLDFVDNPAARKAHHEPTPLMGGVAIAAAVLISCFGLVSQPVLYLLAAASVLSAVGLADDRRPLPWQVKLAVQIAAAYAMAASGVGVNMAWLPDSVNSFITVFWFVGITNAVNFLDNMNGLSAGLSAISSAVISVLGIMNGCYDAAAAASAVAFACLGFIRYNHNWKATVFMGDCGSLFLGMMLAGLAVLLRFPANNNWVTWLCPVLLLAVPVFDMTHVCIARIRRGCNPFSTPGKDHTSHLLVKLGLHDHDAVLIVHACVLACGLVAAAVAYSGAIAAYALAGAVTAAGVFGIIFFELRFGGHHNGITAGNGEQQ